ncbi:MAG: RDD family protein [Opitutaceae bacterium]|nr:RDD family protein [Opitutaceae bacterium]
MKKFFRPFNTGCAAALFLALVLTGPAQDQTAPVSDTLPPAPALLPAVQPLDEAADNSLTETVPAAESASGSADSSAPDDAMPPEFRRLDSAGAAEEEEAGSNEGENSPARRSTRGKLVVVDHGGSDRVALFNDNRVEEGETIEGDVVSIIGDTFIDGETTGDAVAVMGNVIINGTAEQNVVAVMGSNTINGTVQGDAIAVMGDLTLGPKAIVTGKAVCVGGEIHRDLTAIVEGGTVQKEIGQDFRLGAPLTAWWMHGLKLGRPLAIGAHLAWLWIITVGMLAFYALLALVFPRGIRKCGDMLVQRPVMTVMSALLSVLALPVLFVLLLITVIGIPVALLVLPVGILLLALFGKAAIYALVGRLLSRDRLPPALAVLVGGLILVALYLVPFVGLVASLFVSFLGFGCVVATLLTPSPKAAGPAAATGVAGFGQGAPSLSGTPLVESEAGATIEVPPVLTTTPTAPSTALSSAMPRAGFWIRTGALAIDGLLIAVVSGPLHAGPAVLLLLATYAVLMWKHKGTTIGGIICRLKVVRLDDRPVDWSTAIVRALGCFLSLIVAGLGFIWVAFDDEKQSWHDKIAGTTVVKVPRSISLV